MIVKCLPGLKNDEVSDSLTTLLRVTAENCRCPIPKFNLTYLYQNGIFISVNKNEACKFYKMAFGSATAMNEYGAKLFRGNGVAIDKVAAVQYIKKAVDKGENKALFNYALVLDKGEGVSMNKKEAAKYFKMAAD